VRQGAEQDACTDPAHPAAPPAHVPCRAARSVIAQSAPTMSLEVSTSQVAQMSTSLLAVAKETDFGGYTGPAVGLVLVAVLISVLTNPYDDLAGKK